jgi:hypothetical protein
MYLYIILDEAYNVVKIGRSGSPDTRLKQIQYEVDKYKTIYGLTKCKLKVICVLEENRSYSETVLHRLFKANEIAKEWFEFSGEIKEFVYRMTASELNKYVDVDKVTNEFLKNIDSNKILSYRPGRGRGVCLVDSNGKLFKSLRELREYYGLDGTYLCRSLFKLTKYNKVPIKIDIYKSELLPYHQSDWSKTSSAEGIRVMLLEDLREIILYGKAWKEPKHAY